MEPRCSLLSDDVSIAEIKEGIEIAERAIDKLLNTISSRLGLDHDRVLGSVYSFPIMTHFLVEKDLIFDDHKQRDKLLYWYIHTMLWGRYGSSTESTINRDLGILNESNNSIDGLIKELRKNRGDLKLYPGDFSGWSRGARFYPMMYQ